MAEALLNQLAGEKFEATSAGLEKGTLNPLAIQVMDEIGLDISGNQTREVFDLFKAGRMFNYVITVCDAANSERCPIFPGAMQTLHWSFSDPSSFTGTWDEKLEKTRQVRDEISLNVKDVINGHIQD